MPRIRRTTFLITALLVVLTGALHAQTMPADEPVRPDQELAPRQRPAVVPLEQPIDPETYRLGPGDELSLSAGGISDWHQVLLVSPEGTIRVPNLGVRQVAGRTLAEVRRSLVSELRRFFPRSPVEVVLTHPRSFKVLVAGDVRAPGPVVLYGPGRVYDALQLAGGSTAGPRRNVLLLRGKREISVDLLAYQRLGDIAQNPMLQDGDVIRVGILHGTVGIYGGVGYPGQYELRAGETAGQLIELCGGLVPGADSTRVRLLRFSDARQADTLIVGPGVGRPLEGVALQDGDQLFVSSDPRFHETHVVQVSGSVIRPSLFPVVEGQTRFSDVIALAGGLDPRADSSRVTLSRPTEAPPADTAYVSLLLSSSELRSFEREYAHMRSRVRTLLSFDPRQALLRPGSAADPLLRSGDLVEVPRIATSVLVQGQVLRPGLVQFQPGEDYRQYVRRAGGFTRVADKGNLWVTLAATQQMLPAADAPRLRPGDVVWVPAKERGHFWATVRDVLVISAQLSTIYLVVHDATRSGN